MKLLLTPGKNRLLLYIIIIFSLAAFIVMSGYFRKSSKKSDQKKTHLTKSDATVSIQPLFFSQEIENKNKFTLSAESADFFQEQGKGILKNFSITYSYNEDKKITISGTIANIDINGNKDLSGDFSVANIYSGEKITAVSSEGYRFETKNLLWNGTKKIISTKDPITFYGNNLKLTGQELNVDIDDETMEIIGKVDATVTPESLNKLNKKNTDVINPIEKRMQQ